jgi:hypothetical protein
VRRRGRDRVGVVPPLVEALMSSLLHELLHDLRQRCGHLLEELRKLDKLHEEARPYRDKTEMRVERAGQHIETLLADPDLNHPLLVRNYYHDYKRLSEMVFNLESGPVTALKHFEDDDRDITRVVARICQEIGYPYAAPLCVAFSSQYYWALPSADLVFVPCSEPFHLLSLADLYHELAHFILEREKRGRIVPLLRIIDDYFQQRLREAQQNNWPSASIDRIRERKARWEGNWYEEFAADMLAAFWAGPAFGWCNLRLCTNQSVELFYATDIHPADDARHAGVQAMLLLTGNDAAAARIDTRWKELVALSGQTPPDEYELTYPKELMDQIAAAVFTVARDMSMTPWSSSSTVPDFHIGSLLNSAWGSFFSEPATFASFEKKQIDMIRAQLATATP